ncbi:conserved hypothetical protein, partial [Ricinus communis]
RYRHDGARRETDAVGSGPRRLRGYASGQKRRGAHDHPVERRHRRAEGRVARAERRAGVRLRPRWHLRDQRVGRRLGQLHDRRRLQTDGRRPARRDPRPDDGRGQPVHRRALRYRRRRARADADRESAIVRLWRRRRQRHVAHAPLHADQHGRQRGHGDGRHVHRSVRAAGGYRCLRGRAVHPAAGRELRPRRALHAGGRGRCRRQPGTDGRWRRRVECRADRQGQCADRAIAAERRWRRLLLDQGRQRSGSRAAGGAVVRRAGLAPFCEEGGEPMSARTTRVLRMAVVLAAALEASGASALDKGAAAPPFDLPGKDGTVQLAKYQGKVVYVDFWASWCGPCRQSFPWMNEMQAKYGARGLQVVGVNLDAKTDDARRFLAETPARFTIAFDPAGATPRAYGIKGMPSSVLIGPDGKVLFEHAGFKEADRAELEQAIQKALGGAK